LPLRNLPVAIPQDAADLPNAWRQALTQLDLAPEADAYVLALPASLPVRYATLLTVIDALLAFVARFPNPVRCCWWPSRILAKRWACCCGRSFHTFRWRSSMR
jgi:ethanolamine utilization protein EutA